MIDSILIKLSRLVSNEELRDEFNVIKFIDEKINILENYLFKNKYDYLINKCFMVGDNRINSYFKIKNIETTSNKRMLCARIDKVINKEKFSTVCFDDIIAIIELDKLLDPENKLFPQYKEISIEEFNSMFENALNSIKKLK